MSMETTAFRDELGNVVVGISVFSLEPYPSVENEYAHPVILRKPVLSAPSTFMSSSAATTVRGTAAA